MKINLGAFVAHWRTQAGLGVEELASGIMDGSNLRRFENGQSLPSKENLEAIFGRLGINPNSLANIFLDEGTVATERVKAELDSCLINGLTEKANELITQLENNNKFAKNKFNMQHLLAAKAANAVNMGEPPEAVLKILDMAINSTWKKFDEKRVCEYLLTNADLKIISMRAMSLFELGERGRGIDLLYALKENIEKNTIDNEEKGRRLPQIIYHLAMYLGQLATNRVDYKTVSELCDRGRKVCIETSYYLFLPSILMVKADARYQLGDKDGCRKLLIQSSNIFEAFEMYDDIGTIKTTPRAIALT